MLAYNIDMAKKKVLILTNYCGAATGFGRNAKSLLRYLYTNYNDQIEIIHIAAGMQYDHPDFKRFPWTTHGVIPNDPQIVQQLNRDQNLARLAAYGDHSIEDLVYKFKPDIVLAIEDTWGVNFIRKKSFFGKIPVIFWETVDSLPILKESIEDAKLGTQYWTWSKFAEEALAEAGVKVKTQYPCLDTDLFRRLPDEERLALRKKHNLHPNHFIIGFVFRNQLRKLVNKLIEGYAIFKRQHPEIKNTLLYTHTHYAEGWNIQELCKQYGVDPKEVLCTYVCRSTRDYFVTTFQGQDLNNPKTGSSKSLVTANVQNGVTEEQLNEIYNLMDFYVHPATSGACEMPCVEAALTELPIATCDYSFGQDIIKLNKGSLKIDHTFYTEIGTQFLKSNPNPNTIAKLLYRIYSMKPEKRAELGKISREWALSNYSTEINGKAIAEALLSIPEHDWNFDKQKATLKNDTYLMPDISDDLLWVKDLYKNILLLELPDDDGGVNQWIQQLKNGAKRQDIYNFFINTARQDNAKAVKIDFERLLDDDRGKRVLVTMPESAGDVVMAAGLLADIKSLYPEWNIYFATKPEYAELLEGNNYIHKIIPWIPEMDNLLWLEGAGTHKGHFEIAYLLHSGTQRFLNYLHNGKDKTNIDFYKDSENLDRFVDEFTVIDEI